MAGIKELEIFDLVSLKFADIYVAVGGRIISGDLGFCSEVLVGLGIVDVI